MDYYDKASLMLSSNFGVYGYGNFNLNKEELARVFEILDSPNSPENLILFYEQLEKKRMG